MLTGGMAHLVVVHVGLAGVHSCIPDSNMLLDHQGPYLDRMLAGDNLTWW
jgi:hypothetical protein